MNFFWDLCFLLFWRLFLFFILPVVKDQYGAVSTFLLVFRFIFKHMFYFIHYFGEFFRSGTLGWITKSLLLASGAYSFLIDTLGGLIIRVTVTNCVWARIIWILFSILHVVAVLATVHCGTPLIYSLRTMRSHTLQLLLVSKNLLQPMIFLRWLGCHKGLSYKFHELGRGEASMKKISGNCIREIIHHKINLLYVFNHFHFHTIYPDYSLPFSHTSQFLYTSSPLWICSYSGSLWICFQRQQSNMTK